MYDLQFQKPVRISFKKTVYENVFNGSYFYMAFDEVEQRIVGVKKQKISRRELNEAQKEAIVLNSLSSLTSHVPALYNTYYDYKEEFFYLIMQFIDGGTTLRDYLSLNNRPADYLNIAMKICEILAPIHRKNYQHRDLKPENIMIKNNQVYIIDFNLTARKPSKGEGTDNYRSPQQSYHSQSLGNDKTDIFSMGVILYEMLTGEVPYFGTDYYCDFENSRWDFYKPPIEKDGQIPRVINDIVVKCMELNPKRRFSDANQLLWALKNSRRGGR